MTQEQYNQLVSAYILRLQELQQRNQKIIVTRADMDAFTDEVRRLNRDLRSGELLEQDRRSLLTSLAEIMRSGYLRMNNKKRNYELALTMGRQAADLFGDLGPISQKILNEDLPTLVKNDRKIRNQRRFSVIFLAVMGLLAVILFASAGQDSGNSREEGHRPAEQSAVSTAEAERGVEYAEGLEPGTECHLYMHATYVERTASQETQDGQRQITSLLCDAVTEMGLVQYYISVEDYLEWVDPSMDRERLKDAPADVNNSLVEFLERPFCLQGRICYAEDLCEGLSGITGETIFLAEDGFRLGE